MDRIATSQSYATALSAILNAQNQVQTYGDQVSTGKTAHDLAGYATSAQTLTAAQAVKARVDSYLQTNDRLSDRLDAQDTAMTAVGDAATGARKAVMDALASGDGTAMMQALQGWYAQAAGALNTDYEGSYLFAGGQGDTQPVDTAQMSDLPTGGAASHFKNGTLAQTDRVDDGVTLQTGFTASDIGGDLFNTLADIVTQNGLTPFNGTLTQAQQDYLTSKLQPLADAASAINGKVAVNGVTQQRVANLKTVLTDRQTAATGAIGDITDADPAKAASNLTLAQTALQASAQVFQVLSQASLLNILPTST
jgi:flagellar hook-associated protein 3 FlgL